jgi:polyisoprenoid-binding protein YceI
VRFGFPVESLQVDIPAQRQEEGEDFPGALDQSAIDGTRSNMLGEKLLDAANFPEVQLSSREIRGESPELRLLMEITVRDQTTPVEIPAALKFGAGQLVVTGTVKLRQTDLGLEPFSVGLGALSVRDELELKFRLVARSGE